MVFPPSGICEEMILAHFGYTMYCLGPLVIKCTVYAIWLYNVLFKPFGYTMYCLGFGYTMYCLCPLVIQCTV
jgi:hypothetical protein